MVSFRLLLSAIFLAVQSGCALVHFPPGTESCKIRTYINVGLDDYLKTRYHSTNYLRTAVIPFDVQESFAPPGNDSVHYGKEIARHIQAEFYRTGELSILELFNQDRWPGKREEFFTGNYGAIRLARDAGFDLVVVGYLEELTNDREMNFYTKVIDVENGVTIWFGKTMVTSVKRDVRQLLFDARVAKLHNDEFDFPARLEQYAYCTVDRIINAERLPDN